MLKLLSAAWPAMGKFSWSGCEKFYMSQNTCDESSLARGGIEVFLDGLPIKLPVERRSVHSTLGFASNPIAALVVILPVQRPPTSSLSRVLHPASRPLAGQAIRNWSGALPPRVFQGDPRARDRRFTGRTFVCCPDCRNTGAV